MTELEALHIIADKFAAIVATSLSNIEIMENISDETLAFQQGYRAATHDFANAFYDVVKKWEEDKT